MGRKLPKKKASTWEHLAARWRGYLKNKRMKRRKIALWRVKHSPL
jgi:hypothetical protein